MAIFKITHENRAVFDGEKFGRQIRAEYQYTQDQIERMKTNMIHKFRCKDDDGVTYFWGVCSDPNSFAPLDCVGAGLGCTTIEYKDDRGRYVPL